MEVPSTQEGSARSSRLVASMGVPSIHGGFAHVGDWQDWHNRSRGPLDIFRHEILHSRAEPVFLELGEATRRQR